MPADYILIENQLDDVNFLNRDYAVRHGGTRSFSIYAPPRYRALALRDRSPDKGLQFDNTKWLDTCEHPVPR